MTIEAIQQREQLRISRRVAFGEIIRQVRIDKGLSTRQLSAMIDPKLKHRYIQNMESGAVDPTLHMLEKICKALDLA